jgi:hypothetical protein
VQAEHSNHRKLRRSRAGVVSVAVKGPRSVGQVGDEKTNVCEPLLTHRKNKTMASKPGLSGVPGMKARPIVVVCREPGGGLRAGLVVPGV